MYIRKQLTVTLYRYKAGAYVAEASEEMVNVTICKTQTRFLGSESPFIFHRLGKPSQRENFRCGIKLDILWDSGGVMVPS